MFGEFLRLCAEAGAPACPLAALGEPGAVVEDLFAQLQEQPVDVPMPDGSSTEIGYDDAVALAFQSLYSPVAWTDLAATLAGLAQLAAPQQPQARTTQSDVDSLGELLRKLGLIEDYPSIGGALASMCVDGDHPLRPWDYPAQADAADETAPHFGRMRSWVGVQCDVIQFRDRDAYTGPWEQQTDAPVLVIGTRHDPATPYSFTQPYADHFRDARVLTVEGYGHDDRAERVRRRRHRHLSGRSRGDRRRHLRPGRRPVPDRAGGRRAAGAAARPQRLGLEYRGLTACGCLPPPSAQPEEGRRHPVLHLAAAAGFTTVPPRDRSLMLPVIWRT